ncbi:uncharacterized protein [Littorina saxatilis]|uniref:uncharacterized protein n=1 Tax=Littorina saxatilis TaxID=31220 RepID=UPI0038B44809
MCMMQYRTLSKAKDRRPEELEKFLTHVFCIQSNSCKGNLSDKNLGTSQQAKEQGGILSSREENQHSSLLIQHSATATITLEDHKRLQEEKEKAEKKLEHLEYVVGGAHRTITWQTKDIAELTKAKQKLELSQTKAHANNQELQQENRHVKESLSGVRNSTLYRRNTKLKATHQENLLQKEILAQELNNTKEKVLSLKAQKVNLQKNSSKLRQTIQLLQSQLAGMTELANQDIPCQEVTTRLPEHNQFTDDVRKTMIQLQGEANVPASKCRQVVDIVARNIFHETFEEADLPCIQSIINMADEGHVISKLQAAEAILNEKDSTLHTDGTSRDHNKIVGQQLTLPSGVTLSLGFVPVDSETSSNLLDLTLDMLQELSCIYCWQHDEEEKEKIFKDMLTRLSSVMSDRAAVMKKFNELLLEYKMNQLGQEHPESLDIHFLYCNAHYLLGLSRACETAFKEVERDLSAVGLGRDGLAKFSGFKSSAENASSRLIRLTCDVLGPRGDEKNGCRLEWQGFCDLEGKKSKMTSYRANRFNCYFEGAAAIVHHKQDIINFFNKGGVSHSNLKLESVEADLHDQRLVALLAALGVLYFRVTGPYWQLLHSDLPYTEFYKYVQKMYACFTLWEANASVMLDGDFEGIFDEHEISKDNVFDSVFETANDISVKDIVITSLQIMMKHIKVVTENQLADFLIGGKFGSDLPEAITSVLKHCPLTNLLGENAFGDLDFDLSKRRHCSLHHRTTTHMLKRNRTSQHIDELTPEESAKVMKMARKKAKILRKKHRQQEKLVRIKMQERVLENQRQKELKALRTAEVKKKIISNVFKNGGPCLTARDVSRLVKRCKNCSQTLLALKAEIRYQKVVLGVGKALRLTGRKDALITSLSQHLGGVECREESGSDGHCVGADADDQGLMSRRKRQMSSESSDSSSSDVESPDETDQENDTDESFSFQNQGQWISVFYDDSLYVGQVLEVEDKDHATIKFLERTKGRCDFFRWPACEDIAEVQSEFVFNWDFEVNAHSSDGRVWRVPEIRKLEKAYDRIKVQNK